MNPWLAFWLVILANVAFVWAMARRARLREEAERRRAVYDRLEQLARERALR